MFPSCFLQNSFCSWDVPGEDKSGAGDVGDAFLKVLVFDSEVCEVPQCIQQFANYRCLYQGLTTGLSILCGKFVINDPIVLKLGVRAHDGLSMSNDNLIGLSGQFWLEKNNNFFCVNHKSSSFRGIAVTAQQLLGLKNWQFFDCHYMCSYAAIYVTGLALEDVALIPTRFPNFHPSLSSSI